MKWFLNLKVFGKNFILINWQAGRHWENQVCRSLNEAENWFRSNEWAGYNNEQEDKLDESEDLDFETLNLEVSLQ